MAPFVFSAGRQRLPEFAHAAVVMHRQQTLECAPLSADRRCVALNPGKATGFFSSDVRKLTQLGYNYSAFRKS
jgi:hypothetical protein